MVNNETAKTEIGENLKIDLQSEEQKKLIEKLVLVVADTEKIKKFHKRKFDEITEKLESIEESVSKIPKFDVINRSNRKPESAKKFLLKYAFKFHFRELRKSFTKEEKVKHLNLKWCMEIERNKEDHLELVFYCYPKTPVKDDWSIEAKLEFRMIGRDYNNFIRTAKYCFDGKTSSGFADFAKWDDVKDAFVIRDELSFEVEVEILKMSGFEKEKKRLFDESNEDVSDVILVVKDTKFYVSKMYLAAQSPFFKTLFLGNFSESNKSEIPLTGTEPADFQLFLEVLYGESAIDDSTIEGILLIADMYNTPMVLEKCEEFLLEKSKKEFKKKLQISTQYRLKKLNKQCLTKIKKVENVRELLPGDLGDLDPSDVLAILQRCVHPYYYYEDKDSSDSE